MGTLYTLDKNSSSIPISVWHEFIFKNINQT